MPKLNEYTDQWLAEWEQKQANFNDCTRTTDYEKFILLIIYNY